MVDATLRVVAQMANGGRELPPDMLPAAAMEEQRTKAKNILGALHKEMQPKRWR